jgi:hypothetical protein
MNIYGSEMHQHFDRNTQVNFILFLATFFNLSPDKSKKNKSANKQTLIIRRDLREIHVNETPKHKKREF